MYNIDGYVYIKNETNEDLAEVIVYYAKIIKLKINMIDLNSNRQIKEPIIIEGIEGEQYDISSIVEDLEDYKLTSDENILKGKFTSEQTEINLYFTYKEDDNTVDNNEDDNIEDNNEDSSAENNNTENNIENNNTENNDGNNTEYNNGNNDSKNNSNNGTNNNENKQNTTKPEKDSTSSNNNFPNTGKYANILIIIGILIVISVISYKKYKDITLK